MSDLSDQLWSEILSAPKNIAQGIGSAARTIAAIPENIYNAVTQPRNYFGRLLNASNQQAANSLNNLHLAFGNPADPTQITNPRAALAAGMAGMSFAPMGIMAGPKAATANLESLAVARKLASSGVHPEAIWRQTGWALNTPDGIPRFEIPDQSAELRPGWQQAGHVGSAVQHPSLFSAYPDLAADWFRTSAPQTRGSYASSPGNPGMLRINPSQDAPLSTALHELQHAVQRREGMAAGGTPDSVKSALGNEELANLYSRQELYNAYQRLAGEAEARMTQARQMMTPQQRIAQYPYDPQYFQGATGVPMNSLIVNR